MNSKRKRVANFTPDEKALLVQLIKNKPIIESKLTDGKSILMKKAAWDIVTAEFNSNALVHKRDTATLKRAWDNLKAVTRKAKATDWGSTPPQPHQGSVISLVEEPSLVVSCEIKNPYDSDEVAMGNTRNDNENESTNYEDLFKQGLKMTNSLSTVRTEDQEDSENMRNVMCSNGTLNESAILDAMGQSTPRKKTEDPVRREALLRLKYMEAKKKADQNVWKLQLESALLEKERQELLLHKAKLEVEKAKLELEEMKKKLA